jgi:peptidoglycan biosynthesis protein MviN/MurJ (putative lipid II flippase)
MESKVKILNAVKIVGGTVLSLGVIMVLIGFFESDYNILISIGIGTVIGAVFIFLMGIFFVVTEEMHEKSNKGIVVSPLETK